MLHRHKCERKGRYKGPESTAHQPRLGHGIVDSLEHSLRLWLFQREERLHAKEVRVEERGECELIYDDFQAEVGNMCAEVVETRGQEDEVAVAWDGGDAADCDGSKAAGGVVGECFVGIPLYDLTGKVTQKVDD